MRQPLEYFYFLCYFEKKIFICCRGLLQYSTAVAAEAGGGDRGEEQALHDSCCVVGGWRTGL
jgi:hypothetical protein